MSSTITTNTAKPNSSFSWSNPKVIISIVAGVVAIFTAGFILHHLHGRKGDIYSNGSTLNHQGKITYRPLSAIKRHMDKLMMSASTLFSYPTKEIQECAHIIFDQLTIIKHNDSDVGRLTVMFESRGHADDSVSSLLYKTVIQLYTYHLGNQIVERLASDFNELSMALIKQNVIIM